MKLVEIDGRPYVKLSLDEALARVHTLWKRHPDLPLERLYQEDLAALRRELTGQPMAAVPQPVRPPRELASCPRLGTGGGTAA